jgi:glycosyltransferase involved in cell wall biosynthesis
MVSLLPFRRNKMPTVLLRALYSGRILVPSYRSLLSLTRMSLDGDVLTPAVDRAVYRPAQRGEKDAVRKEYGFEPDDFVFLLGPQTPASGEALIAFEQAGDVGVVAALEGDSESGARAVRGVRHSENPAALYWLADCFVFAETDANRSAEVPMCVVEALACGVPVLTRPIGGLHDFFAEGDDFYYWNTTDELISGARRLRENYPAQVRVMDEFSWGRVVSRIRSDVLL